jgi:hypothetical protein
MGTAFRDGVCNPVIGDHVDDRIGATVSRVGCANFKHPGRRVRFINQVMAIGITTPEGRAVTGARSVVLVPC